MHPATTSPATATLDSIVHLLSLVLLSSFSITSFTARWKTLRHKLTLLQSNLSSLSSSASHPLLSSLLPSLFSTLQSLKSLSNQCLDPSSNPGKLFMQSNLDMASSSLSKLLHDTDLLLKSGILDSASNAIVLSQPGSNSSNDDLGFFIKDLFTRLQIGGIEFKLESLDSLVMFLSDFDVNKATLVSQEGNVGYLVNLLDCHNHPSVREKSVIVLSVLCLCGDLPLRCVFEEGGLGPLLRMIDNGNNMRIKEKAAIAVEAITRNSDNAWAISAYSGVSILVHACRSGSLAVQIPVVGAIKNVSCVGDIRVALGEEGAVPILVQLLVSGNRDLVENVLCCLSILATYNEELRESIIREGALLKLLALLDDFSINSNILVKDCLRTIIAVSGSGSVFRVLSSSNAFVIRLCEFVKHGNVAIRQLSASLIGKLSISDANKRVICSCMGTLVKSMESPKPAGLQEASAQALVSLLTVRSNRKELVKDEKSVVRLVQMLDPINDVIGKKFPVLVIGAILAGGSNSCRKRLMAGGTYPHLQRLAEMEIAGAKKALQRLAGNRVKNILSRTWKVGKNNEHSFLPSLPLTKEESL